MFNLEGTNGRVYEIPADLRYRFVPMSVNNPHDWAIVCMLHSHSIFAHTVFRGTQHECAQFLIDCVESGIRINWY